jgi:hypothetical protein
MPPLTEDLQMRGLLNEYIGAVSIPEIMHFVHGGSYSKVLDTKQPFRVLFAEYVNMKSVLVLLAYAFGSFEGNVEITVLTADVEVINSIKQTVRDCSKPHYLKMVNFIDVDLDTYITQRLTVPAARTMFDYIEYYGGLSLDPKKAEEHIPSLQTLLAPDGVIGITFFAKNIHQSTIHSMVENRIGNAMIPFSQQTNRIVEHYFKLHNLHWNIVEQDTQLVRFLAHDVRGLVSRLSFEANTSSLAVPFVDDGKAYHLREVESLLKKWGYRVRATFPTAFSRPYEEFGDSTIRQLKASGVSETDATFALYSVFRKSVYVTRAESCTHGRIIPSVELFRKYGDRIKVVDRLANLGASFANARSLAFRSQPVEVYSNSLFAANNSAIGFVVNAQVSPCMQLLSASPTLKQLHAFNVEFYSTLKSHFSEEFAVRELMDMLRKFISINAVTLRMDGGYGHQPYCSQSTGDPPEYEEGGLYKPPSWTTEVEKISASLSRPSPPLPYLQAPVDQENAVGGSGSSQLPPSSDGEGHKLDAAKAMISKLLKLGYSSPSIIASVNVAHPLLSSEQVSLMIKSISGSAVSSVDIPDLSNIQLSQDQDSAVAKLRARGFSDSVIQNAFAADRANKDSPEVHFISPIEPTVVPGVSNVRPEQSNSTVGLADASNGESYDAGQLPQFSLAFVAKIERMQSMGFPEAMIEEAIRSEMKRFYVDDAVKTSEVDTFRGPGLLSVLRNIEGKEVRGSSDGRSPTQDSGLRSSGAAAMSTGKGNSGSGATNNVHTTLHMNPVVEKKVRKMREMGFPDSMIDDYIRQEQLKQPKSSQTAPSNGSSTQVIDDPTEKTVSFPSPPLPNPIESQPKNESSALDDIKYRDKIQKMRNMGIPDSVIEYTIMGDRAKDAKLSGQQSGRTSVPTSSTGTVGASKVFSSADEKHDTVPLNAPTEQSPGTFTDQHPMQAKIDRMRAMGFPEQIIEAKISEDSTKAPPAAVVWTGPDRADTQQTRQSSPIRSKESNITHSSSHLDERRQPTDTMKSIDDFDQKKVNRLRDMNIPDDAIMELLIKEDKAKAAKTKVQQDVAAAGSTSGQTLTSDLPKDKYKMYELDDRIADLTAKLSAAAAASKDKGEKSTEQVEPAVAAHPTRTDSGRTDLTKLITAVKLMSSSTSMQQKSDTPDARDGVDLGELHRLAAMFAGDRIPLKGSVSTRDVTVGERDPSSHDLSRTDTVDRGFMPDIVVVPKMNSLSNLQASFRSSDCIMISRANVLSQNRNHCDPLAPPADGSLYPRPRRTANLLSSSFQKASFDLEQLQYLITLTSQSDKPKAKFLQSILPHYVSVVEYFDTSSGSRAKKSQAVRLPQPFFEDIHGAVNRIIQVDPEAQTQLPLEALVFDGAIKQIRCVRVVIFAFVRRSDLVLM